VTVLVTGGAGFIGSALLRHLSATSTRRLVNVDKLTYAANPESLAGSVDGSRYTLEQVDICDRAAMEAVFRRHRPAAVFHLAAESHVDRSIDSPDEFVRTNVQGTATLLDVATEYLVNLPPTQAQEFRFVHVSTDEVYGDLGDSPQAFDEASPYRPSSPYAASKAASDHLVRAWRRTYGLPVLIAISTNNYGPWQFPEKFIPHLIVSALAGQPLPIYGRGTQVRDWMHVEDHVRALCAILERGSIGETYNIGSRAESCNLDVARRVCSLLDELRPRGSRLSSYASLLTFVADRPGHDTRYALDTTRIERELGWRPVIGFESGLAATVKWYVDNQAWWQSALRRYKLERRGLARSH
jgi:dTDP-glucose 4,6-dehydratase